MLWKFCSKTLVGNEPKASMILNKEIALKRNREKKEKEREGERERQKGRKESGFQVEGLHGSEYQEPGALQLGRSLQG